MTKPSSTANVPTPAREPWWKRKDTAKSAAVATARPAIRYWARAGSGRRSTRAPAAAATGSTGSMLGSSAQIARRLSKCSLRFVEVWALAPDGVPLHPTWVRRRLQRPVAFSAGRADAAQRPGADVLDLVSAGAETFDRAASILHRDVPRLRLPGIERARERLGVEVRRVDGPLQVEAVVHMGEEDVQRPLVLLVAAGRAEREVRLAAAQDERRRQRRPRPLPRRKRVRQALLEPEHLRARRQAEAELGNDRRAVQPAAARRRGDEVPPPVDDVEVAGVAARRLADALGDGGGGGAHRRQARLAAVGRAGPQFRGRLCADEPAPLVRVFRREQRLQR